MRYLIQCDGMSLSFYNIILNLCNKSMRWVIVSLFYLKEVSSSKPCSYWLSRAGFEPTNTYL